MNDEKKTTESVDEIPTQESTAAEVPLSETDIHDGETAEGSKDPLQEALAQLEEFKSALQRERADFINFKKRVEREKIDLRKAYMSETLLKVFPIIDDFDRAIESLPDDVKNNEWLTGFTLIHKKFRDMLDTLGIVAINPIGEPFDPNFHEAVMSEDSDQHKSGHIIAVLQKGYVLEDKCLRPAMVKVAS
jgi:molecular chaperone GrpE